MRRPQLALEALDLRRQRLDRSEADPDGIYAADRRPIADIKRRLEVLRKWPNVVSLV
jgi:hypothetical protein